MPDVIFRLFYADERNTEFLISLLKSILNLPDDDYHEIEIADPHLLREFDGDKLAIIDIKLHTKSRKIVHIEIQLKVTPELKKRIVLYNAKLIAEQIGSGDDYDAIKKVISIIITEENLLPGNQKYHHRFTLYDANARIEFTDILEIHTLELQKLPTNTDGTDLYDWAKFIAAESEEELAMIENPQVQKAVVKRDAEGGFSSNVALFAVAHSARFASRYASLYRPQGALRLRASPTTTEPCIFCLFFTYRHKTRTRFASRVPNI